MKSRMRENRTSGSVRGSRQSLHGKKYCERSVETVYSTENMTEPNEKRKQAYIPCPICGEKTDVKVYEDTVLVNFPLYCPKCGKEVKIDVFDLRMVQSRK